MKKVILAGLIALVLVLAGCSVVTDPCVVFRNVSFTNDIAGTLIINGDMINIGSPTASNITLEVKLSDAVIGWTKIDSLAAQQGLQVSLLLSGFRQPEDITGYTYNITFDK